LNEREMNNVKTVIMMEMKKVDKGAKDGCGNHGERQK
jgi:hypothetical protein